QILIPAAQQKHPDRNYQSIEKLLQETLSASPEASSMQNIRSDGQNRLEAEDDDPLAGSVLTKNTAQGKDGLK
ncbi:MAG: hypothetical protein ACFNYI_04495, partial [Eubacterium sp.]